MLEVGTTGKFYRFKNTMFQAVFKKFTEKRKKIKINFKNTSEINQLIFID